MQEAQARLSGNLSTDTGSSQQSSGGSHSLRLGKKYLIETVTKYFTGVLQRITDRDIVLNNAAWIAETGRYHDALSNYRFPDNAEIEPLRPEAEVVIRTDSIVLCVEWKGDLPVKQQ
jgi:hypothetical protein